MRVSIDEVKQSLFTAAEVHAAFKMSLLVKVFGPSSAAFLSCYSIGVNKRIIPSKKFLWFFAIISALGTQLACKVLLFWHHYYRIELPINPELHLKLNMLTDSECKEKFRFSHWHIQLLVSRLGFPDVIIIPHHKDCISAIHSYPPATTAKDHYPLCQKLLPFCCAFFEILLGAFQNDAVRCESY